jgi:hypothetical protein
MEFNHQSTQAKLRWTARSGKRKMTWCSEEKKTREILWLNELAEATENKKQKIGVFLYARDARAYNNDKEMMDELRQTQLKPRERKTREAELATVARHRLSQVTCDQAPGETQAMHKKIWLTKLGLATKEFDASMSRVEKDRVRMDKEAMARVEQNIISRGPPGPDQWNSSTTKG